MPKAKPDGLIFRRVKQRRFGIPVLRDFPDGRLLVVVFDGGEEIAAVTFTPDAAISFGLKLAAAGHAAATLRRDHEARDADAHG